MNWTGPTRCTHGNMNGTNECDCFVVDHFGARAVDETPKPARYLVGGRVLAKPPHFYTPSQAIRGDRRERIGWQDSGYDFYAKRGSLKEFSANGRRVVARMFPTEYDAKLAQHDEKVARAQALLKEAEGDRRDFLEMVVAHAKPVKVTDARVAAEAWIASGKEEEERKAEVAKTAPFMKALNEKMGDFVGKVVRR